MKKLISVVLCGLLGLSLLGCDSNKDVSGSNNTETKNESQKDAMSFDVFEKILTDNGYTISKKVAKAADMLGGEQGYGFETNNGSFELYKFDTNSDAYKKAKNNGVVTLEGFGDFPVVVNKEYVLLTDGIDENIINAFTKY